MKRLLVALAILAGCATAPALPARHAYQMTLPDNSVIVLPDNLTWKDFICTMDNTFCFDDSKTPEFRHQRRGGIYLWRI
jgi:hypothetical protein